MSAQFIREQKAHAEQLARMELRLTRHSAALSELLGRVEKLEAKKTLHLKEPNGRKENHRSD